MAVSEFSFSREWTDSIQFPAMIDNEAQAREDIQALHDETKDYINSELVPALNAVTETSATTVTLSHEGWSEKTQTVSAQGVTTDNMVIVSPVPTSLGDFGESGSKCVEQGEGTLTFTCRNVPENDMTVNIFIVEVTG